MAEALSAIVGVKIKLESDVSHPETAWKLDVTDLPVATTLNRLPLIYPVSGIKRFYPKNQISYLRNEIFVTPDEIFHPCYDFDFRNVMDTKEECQRGNEPYHRPYGWMRFALKVKNKYADGNTWLGSCGWRNHSVSGEWPVSCHGTSLEGAQGISTSYYRAGPRDRFGRGIYSTPDLAVAIEYTKDKQFTSEMNGKTYKVILQNRINPLERVIISERFDYVKNSYPENQYWLVEVPEGISDEEERRIVENAIRPYGVLIKEIM
ncbi:hypothetical protein DNTS_016667 [Danionella cerebrum]|uniref:PARP catalytic domain-containing protein n=1 Tax=Danionella cerebrum TaxID=2873325 RepID=A0A553RFR9_9TELE|nr:hypothetical protein DNTS_016667 [Danionella translucida]